LEHDLKRFGFEVDKGTVVKGRVAGIFLGGGWWRREKKMKVSLRVDNEL